MTNEIINNATTITIKEIKDCICPHANDKECQLFIELCTSLGANPWMKDVHFIKYSQSAQPQFVIGIGFYLKAAQSHPKYRGHKSWTEGEGNNLKGCAEVYVDGYMIPVYVEVDRSEYDTKKAMWLKMPKTMIKKTALSQALRQAFSELFRATYTEDEVPEMINITEENKVIEAEEEPEKPRSECFTIEQGKTQIEALTLDDLETVTKGDVVNPITTILKDVYKDDQPKVRQFGIDRVRELKTKARAEAKKESISKEIEVLSGNTKDAETEPTFVV